MKPKLVCDKHGTARVPRTKNPKDGTRCRDCDAEYRASHPKRPKAVVPMPDTPYVKNLLAEIERRGGSS